ncbi:HEAT repeat domain-containing protein [Nocardia brasiliensis]|uniref:HEAT repeat domain-containing protein n=1 Tax=Nocardia brasiliensis TaxID=37326 RepID=UPI002458C450|nr:HEAT repeat domain-containing protein [Nocardia brasiliensis]
MSYEYARMPQGDNWLDDLPARYRHGHNGFDLRLARELAEVGVRCYTLGDLSNGPRTIPPAIPIFVDWLEHLDERIPGPQTHHKWAIRTGLIRNLIDPAAKRNRRAIDVLFREIERTDAPLQPHVEFWAVSALDTIAERSDYDRMVRLLHTLSNVESKVPILHYLGQFKTAAARELILPFVADSNTRAPAIKALARFGNSADRALIAQYRDDANAQVRNAVKSALAKIGAE